MMLRSGERRLRAYFVEKVGNSNAANFRQNYTHCDSQVYLLKSS